MDKIAALWKKRRGLFLLLIFLALVVLALAFYFPELLGEAIWGIMLGAAIIVGGWFLIDHVIKEAKRIRQRRFDAGVAAKEGIADRQREWATWTQTMRDRGIDRYELPFYLLVGEPQSGKSVLLQNSELHFPFGTSRLSGPGGTRGCDWWFTDEAVILDLAGRLFTHEGGASDEAEWQAFLKLLSEYRPLSPADGIILVIPCDSLLRDSAEAAKRKVGKIKDALVTLVTKLQAQLPIYVVLTKADRIFGFAETFHRLAPEKRLEMFGWSRPAERFDEPFSSEEFRGAFEGLVQRAELRRSAALSDARIPDALGEIDRMFAFPEELRTLRDPLEGYLKHIFAESNLVELLFFRGFYVTSGLQKGVPIAQACARLLGGQSAVDSRELERLFTKQRAYFIRDLIRQRVFPERGLVRPTSRRVKRSRQIAVVGYGFAAALAVIGTLFLGYKTFYGGHRSIYAHHSECVAAIRSYLESPPEPKARYDDLMQLLHRLKEAAANQPLKAVDGGGDEAALEGLYVNVVANALPEAVKTQASFNLADETDDKLDSYAQLRDLAERVCLLQEEVDLGDERHREIVEGILTSGLPPHPEGTRTWALDDAISHFRRQGGRDDQLKFTVTPDHHWIEEASRNLVRQFDLLADGTIGFRSMQDIDGKEEEFGAFLGIYWSCATIARLAKQNATIDRDCPAALNCRDMKDAWAELNRLKESPILLDPIEDVLLGVGDDEERIPGLRNRYDFLAQAGKERGNGNWDDLIRFHEKLSAGEVDKNARLNILRTPPKDALDRLKSLNSGSRLPLGIKVPGWMKKAADGVRPKEEGPRVGQLELDIQETDLLSPFASEDDLAHILKTCSSRICEKKQWERPEELTRLLESSLANPLSVETAITCAASLTETFHDRYPTFEDLAADVHDRNQVGAFNVTGLKVLGDLLVQLTILRNAADRVDRRDERASLDQWIEHAAGLYQRHTQDALRALEQDPDPLGLQEDLVRALCQGSSNPSTGPTARQALAAYLENALGAWTGSWSEGSDGRSADDLLGEMLKQLDEVVGLLDRIHTDLECDCLPDETFRRNTRAALAVHRDRLTNTAQQVWDARRTNLEESLGAPDGGQDPATWAAKRVAEHLQFAKLESAWENCPDLDRPVRLLDTLKSASDFLGKDGTDLKTLCEQYGKKQLLDAAAHENFDKAVKGLRSMGIQKDPPTDDAPLVELVEAILAAQNVCPTGPFGSYCHDALERAQAALGSELSDRYFEQYDSIVRNSVWEQKLFEDGAGEEALRSYSDSSGLVDYLNQLFGKDGDLILLRERFGRDRLVINTADEGRAEFDTFLTELAGFLCEDGKVGSKIRNKIVITVRPPEHLDGPWRDGFWYPSVRGNAVNTAGKPELVDWNPYEGDDFGMAWDKTPRGFEEAEDFRVPGHFGPLFLAWTCGERDGPNKFRVELSTDAGRRVVFDMEFDRPVPDSPPPVPPVRGR